MRDACVIAFVIASAGAAAACREKPPPTAELDAASSAPASKESAPPPLPNKITALKPPPVPTGAVVALGRSLFFDERLSASNTISCATCHDPDKGLTDGLPFGKGHQGKRLARNTPSVLNVDARAPFFWDGRAATAEEQALGPVTNNDEMAQDLVELVKELEDVPEYVARFELAFGKPGIDSDRIAKALASFERTLVSADAPIDRYLAGDKTALGPEAQRGFTLFTGKAECVKCHDGPHFTDASFHNIGVKGDDPGRFKIVPVPILKGAFKTPGLRDVELTAPYFHDGSAPTLMAVVEHYDRGGDTTENLDKDIHKLNLSAVEKDELVAFMKALTGKKLEIERPRLPRVNKNPRNISTKALMKDVDGMLDSLDKLIARLDEGRWDDARAAIAKLTSNAEELAALRARLVGRDRLPLLKQRIGSLLVAFGDLDAAVQAHRRPEAVAAYEAVRERCEQCHESFRAKGK